MKITKTLRIFLILLSVMMVLPLFACGDTPEETTTKAPEQTTAPDEKETTADETDDTTEPKAPATTVAPDDDDDTTASPAVDDTTEAETTSAETTDATTESGSETTETGSESSETAETTEGETTEGETTEGETTEAPCQHVEEAIPAVDATCEETGLTAGKKCSVCGEILVEQQVVPALGHAWDEGKVTTEPDCDDAGVKTFTCQNDATHTKTEAIDAKGHTPVTDAAVAPTCEATGLTEGSHCDICSAVIKAQEKIDALGHAWDEGKVTTDPTCEEKGVKTYTCTNDASHTKTEDVAAIGHAWDEGKVTTDPTCEEKGVKTYTCTNDASHTKTEDVAAIGHAWDEGKVTTNPTCTEKGVKTYTCTNDASHTKTEDVAANGHDEGAKDIEDNCNVKCTVCGTVLKEGQHDPAQKATAWTHVVENDGNADGKLYEALLCGDCGKPAETREIFYINCCDSILIDGMVVNPGANPKQTKGFGQIVQGNGSCTGDDFISASGAKIFVTDTINFSGWFAVNGGVAKYIVKIDDGEGEVEWVTMTGAATVDTKNGIYTTVIAVKDEFSDKDGSRLNASYQSTQLSIPGIADYAGKTVTLTVGAVPAGNPGTEDNPNYITVAEMVDVEILPATALGNVIDDIDVTIPEGAADGANYTWIAPAAGEVTFTFPTVDGVEYNYSVFFNGTNNVVTNEDAVDGKLTVKVAMGQKIFVNITAVENEGAYAAIETTVGLDFDCKAYGSDLKEQYVTNGLTTSRDSEGNLVVTSTKVADSHVHLVATKAKLAQRYVAITYKTTNTPTIRSIFFAGYKADGTFVSLNNYGEVPTIMGGEWHTVIVDSYAILGEGGFVQELRLDICETEVGQSITIKGIDFGNDLAEMNRATGKALFSISGEEIVPSGPVGGTYDADGDGNVDRDADGNMIFTNKTGAGDAYFVAVTGKSITARYLVVTVKAANSNSAINTFHLASKNKGTTSCGGASIQNYAGEWVTVIVDLADKFGNENYLKYVRIDCLESGKDRAMTLKSIEAYGDLDMAVASAGENPVLTVGFTLPTPEEGQ